MLKLFSSKFILGALAIAVVLPTATYAATADSGTEETEQTVVVNETNCKGELDEETKAKIKAIKAQVKSGEITEEEAKAQLEEHGIKPRHHRGKHLPLDEEMKAELEAIKAQVEAGEITKEEAKAKLEELGIKLMGKGRHFGKHGFDAPEESVESQDEFL
ncbi:hypothetical protein ABN702_16485 [Bacillus haimaensis]|uniref:hypothetical protein n=1 Tax=Bacillus haimaensis TaxID=3160967 RepID=UPI003AA88AE4